ncbi:riboflavin kinase [Caerostris darwini]|uniref:Riboflavin kinase n=1 Tax=Caerostris darwini TaxID=1538125 RepID=A0AAV4Q3J3_9ARAC|nr:riboflavin kinase [Caerostris darwini]
MFSSITNDYSHVLPYFIEGKVCKGFGRGSKELGIPTANINHEVIEKLPKALNCGIYYGLASVNNSSVYKAVLSIGWNPFYQNDKKSLETHILHNFGGDFYGATLKLVILGHIRPERDFLSVEDLINEIKNDIRVSEEKLDLPEYAKYRKHAYFETNHAEGS